jgi:hypothetical protein
MAPPPNVVKAVEAAIIASAHLAAYEHVAAAAQACQRLGSLTSGRWRSAARDLGNLEESLQAAFATVAEELADQAARVGVPEDALWTAGDAAGTLDLLRQVALDELDETSLAARLVQGDVLFGASFVEDPELSDRGTTLLFGWPAPLAPATWPWQATWVVGDSTNGNDDDAEATDELDLYEAGDLEGAEPLLADLADELGCSQEEARTALREAALALTRASLLAAAGRDEDDADADALDDDTDA